MVSQTDSRACSCFVPRAVLSAARRRQATTPRRRSGASCRPRPSASSVATHTRLFLVQSFRLSICPEPALANDQMNLLPRVAEHTTEWRCKLAFGGASLEKGPSSSKHCCSAHRVSRVVVQKPKRVNKAQIEAISVLRIHSPELAPELDMPRHGRYGNRWRGLCVCEAHFPADVSFIREPLSLSLGNKIVSFSRFIISGKTNLLTKTDSLNTPKKDRKTERQKDTIWQPAAVYAYRVVSYLVLSCLVLWCRHGVLRGVPQAQVQPVERILNPSHPMVGPMAAEKNPCHPLLPACPF
jgi:hypothetical protein